MKIGQKDATHFVTPIHIIYYYRYLRFVEDGSIIYHVIFLINKGIKQEIEKLRHTEILVKINFSSRLKGGNHR